MKGTGNLIDGIYNDIGERIIGDIDFLVPESDFLTTAECFKSEGYQICFPAYLPHDQMKHYPRLWKEDVAADLEIHRVPVTQKYAAHFSSEIVQQSKKAVTDFPGCYVLSDNHKVTLNFIHSHGLLRYHKQIAGITNIYKADPVFQNILPKARSEPEFAAVQYAEPYTLDDLRVYPDCNPDEVERVLSLRGGPAKTGSEYGKQNMVYSTAGDL